MKNIFTLNLAYFLVAVAFLGTTIRLLGDGNYFLAGLSGLGLLSSGLTCAIRFRIWLDERALNSK